MASSVDQKRLKATKFPPEFDKKVDIEKVNIDLMKKWIANRITTILGDEDDIVVETCYNLIEQNQFVSKPTVGTAKRLLTPAAQDQRNPNPAHGLPQQGHGAFLQRAMGSHAERARQSYGSTPRVVGGEEGRTAAGAGKLNHRLASIPLLRYFVAIQSRS
jgi:hypothetical protein